MTAKPEQSDRRIDPIEWAKKINAKLPGVTWLDGNTHPETHGYYERAFTDGVFTQYWDGRSWSHRKGGAAHWRQVGDYPAWRGPGFPAATDLQTSEAESLAKRYSNGGGMIGGSALAELIAHVRVQQIDQPQEKHG